MANIASISGVNEVIRNLRASQVKLGEGVARGLKKAGMRLQRESQKLVPVNYGILKASAFTRATGRGMKTVVIVGYTAAYALYVHEAVGMVLKGKPRPKKRGYFWDPQDQAQAKFLEAPARKLRVELRKIINLEGRIT